MRKYTNEQLIESAKKFKTNTEWRRHDGGKERQIARIRGIMAQCCAHMINQRFVKTYSDQDLIDIGKQYSDSTAWRKSKHRSKYGLAIRRGILHLCTAHMPRKAGIYSGIYQVYAYQFPDNTAYIGLTCVPEQRRAQHASGGKVFAKANQLGISVPEPIVLQDKIMSPQDGQEAECFWIEQSRLSGWTLLNMTDGGSIGAVGKSIISKWPKEKVFEITSKFHTVRDWIQSDEGRSYAAASKNGWLPECTAHMIKPRAWTREQIVEVASRYDNVGDFIRENRSCSIIARRRGFYPELTANMSRKRPVIRSRMTKCQFGALAQ